MKFKQQGLVADLMPNIRLMQIGGHFMFNYMENSTKFMQTIYCCIHLFLIVLQFGLAGINLVLESGDVDDLTANTITLLFFTHAIVKIIYFAVRSKLFYRTLGIWNSPNSHPLFAESNARYHAIALKKMRTLLFAVGATTILSVLAWTGITFVGDSVKKVIDPETNETMFVEIPRLMVRSWYPYNASHGMAHIMTLVYQFYWLFFTMMNSNSLDVLFCSWLLFACEQLQHLKQIMKPLMELSATLDTVVPNSSELFKAGSADHLRDTQGTQPSAQPQPAGESMLDLDLRGIYSNRQDFTATFRPTAGMTFNGGVGPNGLTKKQEMLVRSAIKYWVERHKHVVRLVSPSNLSQCGGNDELVAIALLDGSFEIELHLENYLCFVSPVRLRYSIRLSSSESTCRLNNRWGSRYRTGDTRLKPENLERSWQPRRFSNLKIPPFSIFGTFNATCTKSATPANNTLRKASWH